MEWTDDVEYGDWLRARLDDPWRGTMHDVVPRGFPAYVRIFHRPHVSWLPGRPMPTPDEWVRMRQPEQQRLGAAMHHGTTSWAATARAFGTTLHSGAQWSRLVRTSGTSGGQQTIAPDGREYSAPEQGHLDADLVAVVAAHLAAHTSTPDDGGIAVWDGWGGLVGFFGETPARTFFQLTGDAAETDDDTRRRDAEAALYDQHNAMLGRSIHDSFNTVLGRPTWQPGILSDDISRGERLRLPGRDHVLFRGGVSELADAEWAKRVPWRDREREQHGFVPDAASPSLLWPDDHAWVLVTDVDYDSTIVGGSSELVRAVQADAVLESIPLREGISLTWDSDDVNR